MAYEVICRVIAAGAQPAECAAWVQAWGSVGAILVAVVVAWWQFHATLLVARRARREKAFVMVEAVGALLRLYANEIASVGAALERTPAQGVEVYFSFSDPQLMFATVERSIQTIPLHDLPDADSVNLVVAIQHQIRTARDVVARFAKDARTNGGIGVQSFAKAFQIFVAMAEDLAAQAEEAKKRVHRSN